MTFIAGPGIIGDVTAVVKQGLLLSGPSLVVIFISLGWVGVICVGVGWLAVTDRPGKGFSLHRWWAWVVRDHTSDNPGLSTVPCWAGAGVIFVGPRISLLRRGLAVRSLPVCGGAITVRPGIARGVTGAVTSVVWRGLSFPGLDMAIIVWPGLSLLDLSEAVTFG